MITARATPLVHSLPANMVGEVGFRDAAGGASMWTRRSSTRSCWRCWGVFLSS